MKLLIPSGMLMCLIMGCSSISKIDYTSNYNSVQLNEWKLVELDKSTFCSDSSQYFIFSKKATSDNLIIHFVGGGACWNYETCTQPFNLWRGINVAITHNLKSYYIPSVSERMPTFVTGLFENDDKNPFKDWNVVLIPYCTADMQVGNTVNRYASEAGNVKIYHNGKTNVQKALEWIYEQFDAPEKLLVTGDSAGGFATMLYTNEIKTHYNSAKTYQLIDCAYLNTDNWKQLATLWNADIPFEQDSEHSLMETLFLNNTTPDITYLQVSSIYDYILAQFNVAVDSTPTYDRSYMNEWSDGLLSTMQHMANKELDYRYFITDYKYKKKKHDTPHTFIGWSPTYYKCKQDGVHLYEWIAQNILDDQPINVGMNFLESARESED